VIHRDRSSARQRRRRQPVLLYITMIAAAGRAQHFLYISRLHETDLFLDDLRICAASGICTGLFVAAA